MVYAVPVLILLLWVLFNWAAPFAVLTRAQPMGRGRIPPELLNWMNDAGVQFYIADLRHGYGFSIWAPPRSIVVFDKAFFSNAYPSLMRFVIAHELAHFALGHHRKRWFAVVTGAVIFPGVRRWLQRMEDEADAIAEERTGFKRSFFQQLEVPCKT